MTGDINQLLRDIAGGRRTMLLGIGTPGCGDDAAGTVLASRLKGNGSFRSLICEDMPENYTGDVRAWRPETVLLVDAVDSGARAGETVILESRHLEERVYSHRPALRHLMEYITAETGARTFLLGIQPESTEPGRSLSAPVLETVNQLAELMQTSTGESAWEH